MKIANHELRHRVQAAPTPDIVMMDAVALAGAIRSRQVSCVEVMNSYLDHVERLSPHVNAIAIILEACATPQAGTMSSVSARVMA